MSLLHFYRAPGLSDAEREALLGRARRRVSSDIQDIDAEFCYNVDAAAPLDDVELGILAWLLRETFEPQGFGRESFLVPDRHLLEVGPRMTFSTAWSTNAVSICHACGLTGIRRIERSRRYRLRVAQPLNDAEIAAFLALVHDRMTECRYDGTLTSFSTGVEPERSFDIPVLEEGRAALERINREMGLAFDERDLDYYTDLFVNKVGRNPTNVECFDIAQSNSEHSRHWFFKGRLIVDGEEIPDHLIALIQAPLEANRNNSIIAFKDNSSGIRGYPIRTILPARPGEPSAFQAAKVDYDIIFTAETHNFPSGVAPFPGAETGTGGRIRDVHATGRGALVVAGTAAYCVGNLRIPGYELPWEDAGLRNPGNLATPLEIEIEASNGASDYGNKFGEPLIQGFTRSFGLRLPGGERREWIKPIMFSGGIGQLDARHAEKEGPETDMLVVKIGGPAYRIGMGGGAASSMVQGENVAELDFNAVQRGDAEMEQKVNRAIRACVELGDGNPIVSIHDQGAGGNCNVLKEIVDPAGARFEVRSFPVGDETLSGLEIWGAEYQENDALLLRPEHRDLFCAICERENVPVAFVGRVTGDGRAVLHDERDGSTPVDLELEQILGSLPQKTFELERVATKLEPLQLPDGLTVPGALDRVLRLLSVGSKRFLTTKVDRSVTGLVARQQCAGPLQLTVADVAVIAQSAMARLAVAESLTNLVWAPVSGLEDVKCSANWMWAAKLPGEGAALYDAAVAMQQIMLELGIAADGGKDSISMAALAPGPDGDETVKAPGELVVSSYVTCPDITGTVTPDLKLPGAGRLLYVDLGGGKYRLGGSALAHVHGQIGDETPDVEDAGQLKRAFQVVQEQIAAGKILAGHDRSDGGLITTLLEMAFAGNCGIVVEFEDEPADPIALCFAEEIGLVLEVRPENEESMIELFRRSSVPCRAIGRVRNDSTVSVRYNGEEILGDELGALRELWEETSFRLDRLQANPEHVEAERSGLRKRTGPDLHLTFTPEPTTASLLEATEKPRVAMLRETSRSRPSRPPPLSSRRRRSPASPCCARRAATATGRWRRPSSPPGSSRGTSP